MWSRQEAAPPRSLRVEKYKKRQLTTTVDKMQAANQGIIVVQKLLGKQKQLLAATEGKQWQVKLLMAVVLLTASSGRI